MDNMQIVEVVNEAECHQISDDFSEHEFSGVVQGVGDHEFCRIVESEITPYVGQVFTDVKEAEKFYEAYAHACGFEMRRHTTKRYHDGTIKVKLLVCNREGSTYSNKVRKERENMDGGKKSNVDKQTRKHRVRRIGCNAKIQLVTRMGLLEINRFHEGHNHELVEVKDREFQKSSRSLHTYHKEMIIHNSKLKIGATKTYNMCKEHCNGFENIGASVTEFKNFARDYKCYITERDGQMFVDRFKSLTETQEDFFFGHEVAADGSLIRAFWADGIGRRNYALYGDAVAFDPTYGTNKYSMVFTPFTGVDNHKRSVTFCCALLFKEEEGYFDWALSRFLLAMGGKEPHYIITDQDPGIIKSVKNIFKTARHRFCMWHIMTKVPVKYGSNRKEYPDFLKKLNAIVWDEDIEPDEFDIRWGDIMEEYGIVEHVDWFDDVFDKRRQWVMAHCRDLNMSGVMRTKQRSESENSFFKRFENNSGLLVEFLMRYDSAIEQQRYKQKKLDNENKYASPKLITQLPIESHGARVYTHKVFDEFQEELKMSTTGLSVRGFSEVGEEEITKVKDGVRGRLYEITYKPGTLEATCTCRMFERTGLLCRHVLWIYSSHGVEFIPDLYVSKRWTKDASRDLSDLKDVIDWRQVEMTKLWSEVYETFAVLRGRDKVDIERLCSLIRGFRGTIKPLGDELSKQQEIEQLLGVKGNKEITILPPKQARNKGTGRRMLSTKTKAAAKYKKPKRMCKNCKQMAYHDKRNCPNDFAECAPKTTESSSEDGGEERDESE